MTQVVSTQEREFSPLAPTKKLSLTKRACAPYSSVLKKVKESLCTLHLIV
jgi:hypothetical protein